MIYTYNMIYMCVTKITSLSISVCQLADGASDDLLDVGPNDRQLREGPEEAPQGPLEGRAAVLRQVALGDAAQARGHELHTEAHGGGAQERPEQGVAEPKRPFGTEFGRRKEGKRGETAAFRAL